MHMNSELAQKIYINQLREPSIIEYIQDYCALHGFSRPHVTSVVLIYEQN